MAVLSNGEKIGKYWIKNIIKSNTYTETYRIEDADAHPFFLKLFKIKGVPCRLLNSETKIVKEIEYSSHLNHRNIVSFVDQGVIQREDGDFQYYITDYFNGTVLSDFICKNGAFDEGKALKIFKNILDGLQYLHALTPTLTHNDIDPSNIMLSEATDEAVIIDLGHISECCMGDVAFDTSDLDVFYHANETQSGIFNEQGDIFSACCVLYYMLSAKIPWNTDITGDTYKDRIKSLWHYRKDHIIDISSLNISKKVQSVLKRGLALRSTERYYSVGEVLSDLNSNDMQGQHGRIDTDTLTVEQDHTQQSPNYVRFSVKKGTGNGFADIAGMMQLKESLTKYVVFVIKNKEIAEEYKIAPPNGLLLYGPPGCGKTFFAEKFAEETCFNYMLIKSSDLASSYVHGSQEKIRQLFEQAQNNAPIVVCFDEFDALVPDRTWNNVSSEEVNEFLSQMNNCSQRGIFIVATSNRPDKIDPAVLRTGRIDKMVYVPLPDFDARKEMFALHLKGRPIEDAIDIDELSMLTEGYIASDIAYIVNDSATVAAYTRTKITSTLLKTSICNIPPSLRAGSIRQYEDIKQKMEDTNRRIVAENKIVTW